MRLVPMQKSTLALLAAAALLSASGMSGCYTMLVHPGVQTRDEITGAEKAAEVTHMERCTDCHTGDVHGGRSGMRGRHYGAYEGWSDYDPFWGYGGYYDPFGSSPLSSSYFSDNYYSYRNLPWWVYPPYYEGGGSPDPGPVNAPAAKEKPARRGNVGNDDSRGYTPMPSTSRPSGRGEAEKPSTAPTPDNGSENDSDSDKEKPARRGGIK